MAWFTVVQWSNWQLLILNIIDLLIFVYFSIPVCLPDFPFRHFLPRGFILEYASCPGGPVICLLSRVLKLNAFQKNSQAGPSVRDEWVWTIKWGNPSGRVQAHLCIHDKFSAILHAQAVESNNLGSTRSRVARPHLGRVWPRETRICRFDASPGLPPQIIYELTLCLTAAMTKWLCSQSVLSDCLSAPTTCKRILACMTVRRGPCSYVHW